MRKNTKSEKFKYSSLYSNSSKENLSVGFIKHCRNPVQLEGMKIQEELDFKSFNRNTSFSKLK